MRTRLLGPDLIQGLERADEVLDAHENNKGSKWKLQEWQEHLRRAIIHLTNALSNSEDGTEQEAAHGTVRALMALTKIRECDGVIHRLCAEHAHKDFVPLHPVTLRPPTTPNLWTIRTLSTTSSKRDLP